MAERGRVRRGEVPQPHHLPGRHGHHSKASLCNKNISTPEMWLCRHRDYSSGQIQLKWWQGKGFHVEIGRVSIQSFQNWKISVCEDFNGTWDRRQAARPPRRNRNFSNYFDGFSFSLDSGTTAGYEDVFLLKLIQCSIIFCDFPVLFRVFFSPACIYWLCNFISDFAADITTLYSELLIILLIIIWREGNGFIKIQDKMKDNSQ